MSFRKLFASFAAAVLAVSIPAAAASAATSVSSLDFEGGSYAPWTQSGGPTLTVAGGVLEVADRANDFDGIQSPLGLFNAGTTYDLSMRVRLPEGAVGAPGVRFVMKPAYTWIGNTSMSASGWITVSGSYAVPAGADVSQLQVYIGTDGAEPYTYLVDDLSITARDGGGGGPAPDVPPGGAVNPTVTPVTAAEGAGDVAALTFDDGPNPGETEALLDYLQSKDISAVFCVIGQNITAPGGAAILQRIVAEGHTLCNHSTTYEDMGALSQEAAAQRMAENLTIIRTALGDPDHPVPYFRAPNGSWGDTPAAAVSLGMQPLAVINTISDWEAGATEAKLTANLRTAMKAGQVVLVHDGGGDRTASVAAVQTVVDERLAEGWSFTLPAGAPSAPGSSALSTGFEDGLDGWGPRDSGSGAPTVALTTEAPHGGAQAAAVTGRTSQGSGMGHDVTGVLQGGVTYELSAWVRFGAGQPVDAVWLSLANTVGAATTYSTLGQFTGMSNSEWVQVTQTFTMPQGDSAYLYFETAFNGTNTSDLLFDDIVVRTPDPVVIQDLEPIKDTVGFPVGVAVDSRELSGAPAELTLRHFDQLTSENFMKPEAWYTADGTFTPNAEVDALMDFAVDNDLRVYGHTLVWHSQTPAWFFQTDGGEPLGTDDASKAVLRERMREHIFAVAEYLSAEWGGFGDGNPIVAFDVVNEVVNDGSEYADGLRRSEWYRILGEEFIDLAFEYADEAFNEEYAAAGADRPVTLVINDYNTEQGGKQQRLVALVDRLLDRDVPVDGVGHQFHVSLAMPVSALEAAIEAFEPFGLQQVVTELDVTTGTPVTEALLIEQGYYYRDAFRVFREHEDSLFSVSVWGLTDGRSWRASSGAPLVFDDRLQAKPAYYGIVDDELPDRVRTANVFAGDVPLDVAATASIAWRQLPLLRIDDEAAFQLRWSPDHLTAYVTVTDAAVDPDDGVAFTVGDSAFAIGRDGDGDVEAVVEQTADGYTVVAHLPATLAEGDLVDFDVRVTDGGEERGWNTPGVLGTLTLVEPLSYVEVEAAPVAPQIDGVVDGLWGGASVVTTDKGDPGATATVRTLWRDDTLYVLAEVADPVVDVTGSDPWIQDSVEVYVDAGNVKNGAYRYDDTQIRISAANAVSFGTGDEAFQRARVQSATSLVDGGYVVELSVDLLDTGVADSFHGLDFQVNDASGGARTGIRNWADPTGAGYQSTARWGVGRLLEPSQDAPALVVDPASVAAGGTVDVSLSGFEPGESVAIVLQDDRGPAARAGRSSTPMAVMLQAMLGTVTIGADGTATATVTIPADADPGTYRLTAVVEGVALAEAALEITVPRPSETAFTGVGVGMGIWAALGLLAAGAALLVARRRRAA